MTIDTKHGRELEKAATPEPVGTSTWKDSTAVRRVPRTEEQARHNVTDKSFTGEFGHAHRWRCRPSITGCGPTSQTNADHRLAHNNAEALLNGGGEGGGPVGPVREACD